ncbi:MAG: TonB family protein [Candidatus Acidiferrales bacterium]
MRLRTAQCALIASILCPAACLVSQSTPEQPQRVMVDWQTERALLIAADTPRYPPLARAAQLEGAVRVDLVVARDGSTKEAKVLSGPPLFMQVALDAIRTWRFKPTFVAGAAVEVRTIAVVPFFLPGRDASMYLSPYRKAVEKHRNDPRAHVVLGTELLNMGEAEEAAAEFRRAISLDPNDPSAHFGLGDALGTKGDLDPAIKAYRHGLSLNPEATDARFVLAGLLWRSGQLDSAIAEYRSALQLRPKDGLQHHDFGMLLMNKGDVDAAINEFKLAIQYGAGSPSTHYELGRALEQKGDIAAARNEYRKATRQAGSPQE